MASYNLFSKMATSIKSQRLLCIRRLEICDTVCKDRCFEREKAVLRVFKAARWKRGELTQGITVESFTIPLTRKRQRRIDVRNQAVWTTSGADGSGNIFDLGSEDVAAVLSHRQPETMTQEVETHRNVSRPTIPIDEIFLHCPRTKIERRDLSRIKN